MKASFLFILFLINLSAVFSHEFYRGAERMCWKNKKGKTECYDSPRKWYHLNTMMVENDSIFIYKEPVTISKNDTSYSAADGAFYYYLGCLKQIKESMVAYITHYNCDYCGNMVEFDSSTGYWYPVSNIDTLKVIKINNGFKIGDVNYFKFDPAPNFFPSKQMFYFDSNSICRDDPQLQYSLISQGIKNFLQTGDLECDNDTMRICLERLGFDNINILEKLDSLLFKIDTTGIIFRYYSMDGLRQLNENSGKIIRYIEIGQIHDCWKQSSIYLSFKALIPAKIKNVDTKEYYTVLWYDKISGLYKLIGNLPENAWGLIEK